MIFSDTPVFNYFVFGLFSCFAVININGRDKLKDRQSAIDVYSRYTIDIDYTQTYSSKKI